MPVGDVTTGRVRYQQDYHVKFIIKKSRIRGLGVSGESGGGVGVLSLVVKEG